MSQTITISPITRVEGHGKVSIRLNEKNEVEDSHFSVVEFRGFEKFCEGRLMSEMPLITSRICGICPVSHHLASVKACDAVLGVTIPPAAKKLRELIHMGQFIHSHALHFFYLAAPDFVLGPDSDPGKRNVIGIIEANPELGKKAIQLRKIGQNMIERVGGRPIHPVTAIPGGMSKPLTHEDRFLMRREIDQAVELARLALTIGKSIYAQYEGLAAHFAPLKTKYMGLVNNGFLELYDGTLRLIDEEGQKLEEFEPKDYLDFLGEQVEDWSYMKFPYYKKEGSKDGLYRVAPLARMNVAEAIGTPLAGEEHKEFMKLGNGKPVHETLYFHYARLIELLYAAERARELLDDDEIVSKEVRVKIDRQAGEGVGVIEAPRGTLIHHYWTDYDGKIEKANIIVATAHNNRAINWSVNEVAKAFVKDGKLGEGALNRVEMAVRCYDPCLSCATHAMGNMPLVISLLAHDGTELDTIERRA
jgi:NAD-reducing hydrogenase large subunit